MEKQVKMSLLIKNGYIFHKGNLVKKNILVEAGRIKRICSEVPGADAVANAQNKIVIPGLIDSHVHLREPGLTHKEDFLTGSMAAAAGGITTILDMPNTKPETTTLKRLMEKRVLAKKSVVNYGFHFGSSACNNIDEIRNAKNTASVKIYMGKTTGNLIIKDDRILKEIFSFPATKTIHAENECINKALDLSKAKGYKMYFCHVSTAKDLGTILASKRQNVFIEVTPHHLFLTKEHIGEIGSLAEMKPGLKSEDDQKALWDAIGKGIVSTIASDHAPHTLEEKKQKDYPYGVPGCETMLPLLLNAVNGKRLSLKRLVELCCENPAKIFNLSLKGFIEEGYDADLTVIDMGLEKEVKNEELFTKCRWSPFDGFVLKGWPVMTIVSGNIIYDHWKIENMPAKEVTFS